jgi:hypothetical protein
MSGRDVIVVKNKTELVSVLQNPGQACLSFVVDLPRTLGELAHLADTKTNFAIGFLTDSVSAGRKRPTRANTYRSKRSSG